MAEIPIMGLLFGGLFLIVGFSLAVILGLVLYPTRKKEKVLPKESFALQKKAEPS